MNRQHLTNSDTSGQAYESILPQHNPLRPEYPVETNFYQISPWTIQMTRWHWHEEFEILLVADGTVLVKLEGLELTLSKGEGVILNQNLLHAIRSTGTDNCDVYSMCFAPQLLFDTRNQYLVRKYLNPVTSITSSRYLKLDHSSALVSRLLFLAEKAIKTDCQKDFGYELEVQALMLQFWVLINKRISDRERLSAASHLSAGENNAAPILDSFTNSLSEGSHREVLSATDPDDRRIKSAIQYIAQHYSEPISLDDIADSIHISKSECCRCFRRVLDVTPFEFLLRYRIFEAARRIQQASDSDRMSFSDLAYTTGFNAPSYFNKIFRKYMNCTPSEYRRKCSPTASPKTVSDSTDTPLGFC